MKRFVICYGDYLRLPFHITSYLNSLEDKKQNIIIHYINGSLIPKEVLFELKKVFPNLIKHPKEGYFICFKYLYLYLL